MSLWNPPDKNKHFENYNRLVHHYKEDLISFVVDYIKCLVYHANTIRSNKDNIDSIIEDVMVGFDIYAGTQNKPDINDPKNKKVLEYLFEFLGTTKTDPNHICVNERVQKTYTKQQIAISLKLALVATDTEFVNKHCTHEASKIMKELADYLHSQSNVDTTDEYKAYNGTPNQTTMKILMRKSDPGFANNKDIITNHIKRYSDPGYQYIPFETTPQKPPQVTPQKAPQKPQTKIQQKPKAQPQPALPITPPPPPEPTKEQLDAIRYKEWRVNFGPALCAKYNEIVESCTHERCYIQATDEGTSVDNINTLVVGIYVPEVKGVCIYFITKYNPSTNTDANQKNKKCSQQESALDCLKDTPHIKKFLDDTANNIKYIISIPLASCDSNNLANYHFEQILITNNSDTQKTSKYINSAFNAALQMATLDPLMNFDIDKAVNSTTNTTNTTNSQKQNSNSTTATPTNSTNSIINAATGGSKRHSKQASKRPRVVAKAPKRRL